MASRRGAAHLTVLDIAVGMRPSITKRHSGSKLSNPGGASSGDDEAAPSRAARMARLVTSRLPPVTCRRLAVTGARRGPGYRSTDSRRQLARDEGRAGSILSA